MKDKSNTNPCIIIQLIIQIGQTKIPGVTELESAYIRMETIKLLADIGINADLAMLSKKRDCLQIYFEPLDKGDAPHSRICIFIKSGGCAKVVIDRLDKTHSFYNELPIAAVIPLLKPELSLFFPKRVQ